MDGKLYLAEKSLANEESISCETIVLDGHETVEDAIPIPKDITEA